MLPPVSKAGRVPARVAWHFVSSDRESNAPGEMIPESRAQMSDDCLYNDVRIPVAAAAARASDKFFEYRCRKAVFIEYRE